MFKNKNRVLLVLLASAMFCSGAASIINEMILSSISTMILGNSLEQFSLTIGIMLFAMGIGGFSQQFFSDKYLVEKFIILEIILALVGSYSPIGMYAAFAYIPEHFNLVNYACIFSIGYLVGFEIPFIIRMVEKYNSNLKRSLASIFSADYIGAFGGTLLWVGFLLTAFPFTQSSFLVAGSNLFVAIITFLYFLFNKKEIERNVVLDKIEKGEATEADLIAVEEEKINKTVIIYPILLVLVVAAIVYGYKHQGQWNVSLEQKLFKDPIVFETTTKYQHIVVTDNKQMNETRLYINGNVQFSSLDEKRYHEMLIHPVMKLAPKHENVLVLGGGDGLAVRELKKYKGIKNLTLIDLDKAMIEFSKTNETMKKLNNNAFENVNFVTPEVYSSGKTEEVIQKDENGEDKETVAYVDVMNIDAEKFLHNVRTIKWDVIIIDLPDPSVIELVKLYSKEFYMALTNVMNGDAMVVIQSTSPYHAKESFLCIGRTMEAAGLQVIPFHHNIPSFGDWGWFIGWKSMESKTNMMNKMKMIEEFDVETDYLTPDLFKSSLSFGKKELDSTDLRINSWMNPVLLEIYTKNSWLSY